MPLALDCEIPERTWRNATGRRNGSTKPYAPMRESKDNSEAADAGPWEPAIVKLVEFQHLGDDWDGQGAQAPSHEMLASAIGLAYTLQQQEIDPPSRVVPGPEGAVIFEWQEPDGTYTEIEIVRPFHAEVMSIEPGRPAKHWTLPTE